MCLVESTLLRSTRSGVRLPSLAFRPSRRKLWTCYSNHLNLDDGIPDTAPTLTRGRERGGVGGDALEIAPVRRGPGALTRERLACSTGSWLVGIRSAAEVLPVCVRVVAWKPRRLETDL